MGDTEDKNNDSTLENKDGTPGDTTQTETTPPEKTFPQSEVEKMLLREKNQGRSALLKELGIDPKNAATLGEIKQFVQSKKPEAQVEVEKQLEAQRKSQEYEAKVFQAEAKAEILQAGINKEYLDDALALITAKCTDSDNLMATVEAVKTKYPVWFSADNGKTEEPHLGAKGTGSPLQAGSSGSGKKQPDNPGKRLGEQRKNSSVQSSPWGSRNQ